MSNFKKIYEGSTEEEEPEKSESGPVEKEKPKNIETEKKIAVEDYDPIPEPAKTPVTKETDQKGKPKSENKEPATKPADKKSDKTDSPKKPESSLVKSKTVEKDKVEVVPSKPSPTIKSILKSSKPDESKSPISSTPVKSSDKSSDKISEKPSEK